MTSAPEIRIDQLTGLRDVLAPGRAERPDAFDRGGIPRPGADAECPFCEGREDRTPPEVWAARPGGGEPDTPGWTARAVPEPLPGARAGRRCRAATDAEDFASTADPLRASARERAPDLFARRPAAGHHEVIVNAPEHVPSLTELSEERFAGAVAAWRERMRAHPKPSYLHLIVNEGPDAGASLEHTHAQLYALRSCPSRSRASASASPPTTSAPTGGHLLSDVALGGGAPPRAPRRDRRRGDARLPLGVALAVRAARDPAPAAPRFEAEDEAGTAMIRTALMALARVFGAAPQLNLWVRTAPARRRGLRLARGHRAAADRARGLRDGHGRRHQRLPARARRRRPARSARIASAARAPGRPPDSSLRRRLRPGGPALRPLGGAPDGEFAEAPASRSPSEAGAPLDPETRRLLPRARLGRALLRAADRPLRRAREARARSSTSATSRSRGPRPRRSRPTSSRASTSPTSSPTTTPTGRSTSTRT